MNVKPSTDNKVAVDRGYHWQPMATCPRGLKVQLLTRYGIPVYGHSNPLDKHFVGWCPLPSMTPEIKELLK